MAGERLALGVPAAHRRRRHLGGLGGGRRRLPARLLGLGAVSDPFGMGWDLFGTAHHTISYFLAPAAVWYLMVGVIVVGHAAAIALAHDRALGRLPP